jgi:hypothetical protein
VPYDGGIDLEHNWRECDWAVWVDGTSLPDIMRQATAHAKVCDGKPQPKPAPARAVTVERVRPGTVG